MTVKQQIRKLLNQGKSYDDIWEWSCDKGDLKLVEHLYKTRPSVCRKNVEDNFVNVCYTGDIKLIKFFMENINITTDIHFEGLIAIANAHILANSTKAFSYLYRKLTSDQIDFLKNKTNYLDVIWHMTLAKNMKLTKYLHENNIMFAKDREEFLWFVCYNESPIEILEYFHKNIGTLKHPLKLNDCIFPVEQDKVIKFKYIIENNLYSIEPVSNVYFEVPELGCIIFEYVYNFDESIFEELTIDTKYLLEYKNKRRVEVCTKGPKR